MEGGAAGSSSPTSHAEVVDSFASVGRTTEDLYSVYLHGISQRGTPAQPQHHHWDHATATNPVPHYNTTSLRAVTNNAVSYQNFAREYVLAAGPSYPYGFQQHPRALIGNLRGNPLPPLPPSRGLRFEGIPNANDVSAGRGGSSSYVIGESSAQGAARHKRSRMTSQGNISFQGDNLMACDTSGERFTIYDHKYEEIGLPTDPHLRAFLASNANGTHVGGSTSNA